MVFGGFGYAILLLFACDFGYCLVGWYFVTDVRLVGLLLVDFADLVVRSGFDLC